MTITLKNVGRRFNREWIFRQVNVRFEAGKKYAVLGPNGSGKSTFLQVITGNLTPSEGQVDYQYEGKRIEPERIYTSLSLAAPYLELVEEFTLLESIHFQSRFKPLQAGMNPEQLIALLGFGQYTRKQIRYFSSGMKQRLKLALAVCADTPVLLLDEPTTNFDQQGIEWYEKLINSYSGKDRLLIICSNQKHEYACCDEELRITDYKPVISDQ